MIFLQRYNTLEAISYRRNELRGKQYFIGQKVAEKIYERHQFFTDSLIEIGVDPVQTEKDACRIEHVISDESFQKLNETYKEGDDGIEN